MQLARLYVNIAGQYVIENNVFDEVVSVIFFIVVLLYRSKGDSKYARVLCRNFVSTFYKYSVIGLHMRAERLVCIAVANENIMRIAEVERYEFVRSAHLSKLGAGNDRSGLVDNSDSAVDSFTHLMYHVLK